MPKLNVRGRQGEALLRLQNRHKINHDLNAKSCLNPGNGTPTCRRYLITFSVTYLMDVVLLITGGRIPRAKYGTCGIVSTSHVIT